MIRDLVMFGTYNSGTKEFIGGTDNAVSGSTFTFTNVYIGEPTSDRVIAVAIGARGTLAKTISTVTIGGNTANLVQRGSSSIPQGVASISNDTDNYVDIIVTLSGTMESGCSICVYAFDGVESHIPESFAIGTITTATTTSKTIDCTDGAYLLSVLTASIDIYPISYSGVDKDYEGSLLSSRKVYFASSQQQSSGTKNVQATWGTSTAVGLFVASFK